MQTRGFLVAFANRRDRYFSWAFTLAQQLDEPLRTCEAVLAETAFHLRDVGLVLRMLDTGLLDLDFDMSQHRMELGRLAQRYQDRRPDLADLCLIRMSELNPSLPVLTVDRDFLVYRRNRREVIPTLMPPGD